MPRRRELSDRAAEAVLIGRLDGDEAARLDRKILEELIYERVRLTVDVCEVLAFEADLANSIERALQGRAGSDDDRSQLTLDYLQRAWERVTEETLGALIDQEFAGDREHADKADGPRA
jgi:hypothetical protein